MPGAEAEAGPSAEELVHGIYEHVHASSAQDVEKSMESPGGRRPQPALVELHQWWIATPVDDRGPVRRAMVSASFGAVLGLFRVLDNIRRVVDVPDSELRLLGVTPEGEQWIPADGSTLLSEIFARWAQDDPRAALRISARLALGEPSSPARRQPATGWADPDVFAEQLVQGVHDDVLLPAVLEAEAQMEDPAAADPGSELAERQRWWAALGATDRAMVLRAVRSAADSAIFGFFCVLDGARKIVDVPDLELRLMRMTSAGAERVSEENAEYLHDLYVNLTWDDQWT